jgi:hypothetical protein
VNWIQRLFVKGWHESAGDFFYEHDATLPPATSLLPWRPLPFELVSFCLSGCFRSPQAVAVLVPAKPKMLWVAESPDKDECPSRKNVEVEEVPGWRRPLGLRFPPAFTIYLHAELTLCASSLALYG